MELLSLLKRKGWQVQDVDRNPVVLGVPLGQDGGSSQAVSIDIGLKNRAMVSVSELVNASPQLREVLTEQALADIERERGSGGEASGAESTTSSSTLGTFDDKVLSGIDPVPMAVSVKEDIMHLPVASAVHPRALERSIPEEPLRMLNFDPFLRECKNSGKDKDLIDLIVEGVPGADPYVEAREAHARMIRTCSAHSVGGFA